MHELYDIIYSHIVIAILTYGIAICEFAFFEEDEKMSYLKKYE